MSLEKIIITPIPPISVEGGNVLHGLKMGDIGFAGFGEIYFSWILGGYVKAWKCHSKMTMNLVVPVGKVKFVFHSSINSKDNYRIISIGEDEYCRITVPPGIWFGFQGINKEKSLVVNIANVPHDSDEVQRLELRKIDFDWSRD